MNERMLYLGLILADLTAAGLNFSCAWVNWRGGGVWPVLIAANCTVGLYCLKQAAGLVWQP